MSLAKGALRIAAELKAPADPHVETIQVAEGLLTIPNRTGARTTDVGVMTVVIGGRLGAGGDSGKASRRPGRRLDLTARSPIAHSFVMGLAITDVARRLSSTFRPCRAVKEGGYGASECSFLAADAGEQMIGAALERIVELRRSASAANR